MDTKHFYTSIYCDNCGHNIAVPIRCGRRFCNICNIGSHCRARARIKWICEHTKPTRGMSWKFVTFTMRNEDDPSAMVDHIIAAFRRLRQRHEWTERVMSGVYVIEITNTGRGWHVHLHCIVMMKFYPQRWLSLLWNSVSGSPVVDIKLIKGPSPSGYITKYVTKWEISDAARDDAERAMRHRRLWSPFGEAHCLNTFYAPAKHPCPVCGNVAWMPEYMLNRMFAHHREAG